MALRARWLRGLPAAEREALADVAIREVEERFAAWRADQGADAR
jgi:hypothetical protein